MHVFIAERKINCFLNPSTCMVKIFCFARHSWKFMVQLLVYYFEVYTLLLHTVSASSLKFSTTAFRYP